MFLLVTESILVGILVGICVVRESWLRLRGVDNSRQQDRHIRLVFSVCLNICAIARYRDGMIQSVLLNNTSPSKDMHPIVIYLKQ